MIDKAKIDILKNNGFELTHNRQVADFLKPCPFCAERIMLSKIGNKTSKKKSVEIYCDTCKYEIIKSSIESHEKALLYAVSFWENRSYFKGFEKMKLSFDRWAIVFESKNDRHFMFEDSQLLYFTTKKQAELYIKRTYSYFKREDLKNEPHCWRIPKAVKVNITVEEFKKKAGKND